MLQDLINARMQNIYESAVVNIASRKIQEVMDADAEDFSIVVGSSTGGVSGTNDVLMGGRVPKNLQLFNAQKLRANVFSFYYSNPQVRSIVRNLVKFVFGAGISISFTSKSKNEAKQKEFNDLWKKFEKKIKWTRRQKEMGARGFRDGEVFLNVIDDDDTNGGIRFPYVIFREPDYIMSKDPDITFGIETDKDNVEKVISYRLTVPPSLEEQTIDEKDMVHVKFGVDSNVKRGRTIVEPSLSYIVKYSNWLDDRMVLNKVRTALALVKEVKGGVGAITAMRQKQAATQTTKANRAKMLTPGSTITASPGVEYKMLSANINAGDVKDDGQAVLMGIASGVGMPYMFLSGDFSNTAYASSLTAQNPFVREAEDYRDTYNEYIEELINKVFAKLIDYEVVDESEYEDMEPKIEWPPLTYDSLQTLVQSMSQLKADGIVSNRTYAAKAGLDYEEELHHMEDEESYALQHQQDVAEKFPFVGDFGAPSTPGGAPGGGGFGAPPNGGPPAV